MWDARWHRHRRRIADVALTALVLVPAFAAFGFGAGVAELWWRAPLTVLAAASLWWRRRYPVGVTAAVVGLVAAGASEFALQVALFSLAVRRRDRALVALTAAGVVAFTITYVNQVHSTDGIAAVISGLLSAAFFVGLPVALGGFVGARRDLLASLRERADRAEAEQQLRADQARLAERARIAQEMHDALAHRISLVALHAGGLEVNPAAGPEAVERTAALIRTTARQALEDLRGVLGVLRTDGSHDGTELAPQPTLDDVPRLVEASRHAGVPVVLEDGVPPGVPAVVGRTAYRVVQEGLTNVHKHARGAAAQVRLAGSAGDRVEVEIRNARPAGSDLPPLVPGSGMGLVGLAERVSLTGGHLDSGPAADGGFVVRAFLPWGQEEER